MWLEARNPERTQSREGVCSTSLALDCGENFCLVRSLSTVEQRLRILDGYQRGDDLYCDDSSYDTAFSLNEKQVVIIGIDRTYAVLKEVYFYYVFDG